MCVKATGGGAYKYAEVRAKKYHIVAVYDKLDIICSLIRTAL